ncbi:MAG TPA: DUF1440 domain-containing protein [Hymenobacter sp.]|jgi:hypothetical protein
MTQRVIHSGRVAEQRPSPAAAAFARLLGAGLLVGTLDLGAAFISFYVTAGKSPLFILQAIASGLLGPAAFSGSGGVLGLGLLLHYFIAFCFTALFLGLYQQVGFVARYPLVAGAFYGLFIWVVMNLVVLPLSRLPAQPFHPLAALREALILVFMIGIPLALLASRYFKPHQ